MQRRKRGGKGVMIDGRERGRKGIKEGGRKKLGER